MSAFTYVRMLISTAESEMSLHKAGKAEHPYWYSGHKNRTIRAILAAQEELQRIKKSLESETE